MTKQSDTIGDKLHRLKQAADELLAGGSTADYRLASGQPDRPLSGYHLEMITDAIDAVFGEVLEIHAEVAALRKQAAQPGGGP